MIYWRLFSTPSRPFALISPFLHSVYSIICTLSALSCSNQNYIHNALCIKTSLTMWPFSCSTKRTLRTRRRAAPLLCSIDIGIAGGFADEARERDIDRDGAALVVALLFRSVFSHRVEVGLAADEEVAAAP